MDRVVSTSAPVAPLEPASIADTAPWLTVLLAAACGLIAANIYYAQPLAEPLSAALGMTPAAVGLVVTSTQAGYGLGLLLIVPLSDLVENRRLGVAILSVAAWPCSARVWLPGRHRSFSLRC